jgi:hypothetical protein
VRLKMDIFGYTTSHSEHYQAFILEELLKDISGRSDMNLGESYYIQEDSMIPEVKVNKQ